MEHNSNFKWDLKIGQHFENMLEEILSEAKIEVKTDFRALDTGNMFIEIESRGKPSGIMTSEADYWAYILSKDYIILIQTDKLRSMTLKVMAKKGYVRGGDRNTSKGVLVPIKDIVKHVSKLDKKQMYEKVLEEE